MNRNTRQLKTQFDSFGGLRGELHLNQTLLKNQLAFRGALLADNKKFYPNPSIDRERRAYGALVYKPSTKPRSVRTMNMPQDIVGPLRGFLRSIR